MCCWSVLRCKSWGYAHGHRIQLQRCQSCTRWSWTHRGQAIKVWRDIGIRHDLGISWKVISSIRFMILTQPASNLLFCSSSRFEVFSAFLCRNSQDESNVKTKQVKQEFKKPRPTHGVTTTEAATKPLRTGDLPPPPPLIQYSPKTDEERCSTDGLEELIQGMKYKHLVTVQTHANGGAMVLHAFQDQINQLSPEEIEEFALEFFKVNSSDYVGFFLCNWLILLKYNHLCSLPACLWGKQCRVCILRDCGSPWRS